MDNKANLSGIYQITNLVNNKSYIGLSVNILNRWKQHTFRVQDDELPKSRIRAALKKYGLCETVYHPGRYGNFEFKIIEKCSGDKLFERERYWINKINPEYNCSLLTQARYYVANHERKQKRVWVQYHNSEKENGYPANDALKNNATRVCDAYHYISSKKRSVLYSQGDDIYLVVGIGKKNKCYYLWSRTNVEEVDFLEDDDLIYNAFGKQYYLNPPQLLNYKTGFGVFLKHCGNFGLGFLNITQDDFLFQLEAIQKSIVCLTI